MSENNGAGERDMKLCENVTLLALMIEKKGSINKRIHLQKLEKTRK